MLNLNSASKSIQVKLGEAISTAQVDIAAAYVDLDLANYVMGTSDLVTNGTSLVTVVAAPSSPNTRTVKEILITNTDTIPHMIVVYYVNGASQRVVQNTTLDVNQTLQYVDGAWSVPGENRVPSTPSFTGSSVSLTLYDKYVLSDLAFSIKTLQTFYAPDLTFLLGSFSPFNMQVIVLNLPVLNTIGGSFNPQSMPALNSLTLPALISTGDGFKPNSMNALTSLLLPVLSTVGGSFTPSSMNALTSLLLPVLSTVGGSFNPNSMNALTSLPLVALTTVGGDFNPNSMNALTSLLLPVLSTVGGSFVIADMASLGSILISSALTHIAGDTYCSGNALDQAATDLILVRLAALDGTAGTTTYDNHTIDLSGGTNATPSATGLTAKATLEGRGNTVSVN